MIKTKKQGFKSILTDNEESYLSLVRDAFLAHSDAHAEIILDKVDDTIRVTIKPSEAAFKSEIVSDLLNGHKLIGMKIIFSKSLGISKYINYSITF